VDGPFQQREKLANPFRVGHMSAPRGSLRLFAALTRARWRRGRGAEGGGLLNRYRVVKPYRGFESLRLRHFSIDLIDDFSIYENLLTLYSRFRACTKRAFSGMFYANANRIYRCLNEDRRS
jgi:hypothetical protein